jgi:glycosyl transferase family 1
MNILILVADSARHIGTIEEHITAFDKYSKSNFVIFDSNIAGQLFFDLNLFDVIVFHYSIVISHQNYLSDKFSDRLAKYGGCKILFIQDEYRWIDKTAEAIRELDISVVFSLVAPDTVRKVYHHFWCRDIRFEHTLTGFVSEDLVHRKVPDFENRAVAVAYRARKVSNWIGHHTLQKWQIAEKFMADAKTYGLTVDISTKEEDRIYGPDWIKFISNAQASLGTESGASVCDFTGEIQINVETHLEKFPGATYEELRELYFADAEGQIVMNVISPRCFEAAALRTLMIMYPGDYGGILVPGRHYVVLEKDHSNMDEVVAILRDPQQAGEIIDRAYKEIACNEKWTFRAFIKHFDRVVEDEVKETPLTASNPENVECNVAHLQQSYYKFLRRERRRQKVKVIVVGTIHFCLTTGHSLVRKYLPVWLAKPTIATAKRIVEMAKPLMRRIVLGRHGLR